MPTNCPSCGARNLEGNDNCANCGADLRTIDLPAPSSRIEQSVMQMPLTALGLSTLPTIAPDATVEQAVQVLNDGLADMLLVVDNGRLEGVFSVRDVMLRLGVQFRRKLKEPVRQYMTPKPEILPPDAPITFALNKMDVGGCRHVPVIDNGQVLGVVSVRDVIRYLVRYSRSGNAPGPKSAAASVAR